MLDNIYSDFLLEQLKDQTVGFTPPYEFHSLPDQWIALSLLQKAIRRGDTVQALRAADFLHSFDYRTLWRRLVVIAWEDIGLGNLHLCFMVTAAAGSKRWREANGGDWYYAAYLTIAMSQAIKDRSTDDLMEIAQYDLRFADERNGYCDLDYDKLLEIVHDSDELLPRRIIAAWYCAGTDRYGFEGLRRRKGDIERYFHSLGDELCPEHVSELCRLGVSRSRTVLPAFVPTFWRYYASSDFLSFVADVEISEHMLRGIPRYAFDGFTRAGKRYLNSIARRHNGLSNFLAYVAPPPERDAIVRNMYFRIESACCDKRLNWPIGLEAHKRTGEVGFDLTPETYRAGLQILRDALTAYPMTEADL